MKLLVATPTDVLIVDPRTGATKPGRGLEDRRPTCVAADPWIAGRAWCGTRESGLLRSDEAGRRWRPSGLEGERISAVAASVAEEDLIWAGTEPSAVWRSGDAGATWARARGLGGLPSSSEWSFPPRPDTHHIRWIACHPGRKGQVWVAIEAGALVTTPDGGRTWWDRVPGGPRDAHELAIHPGRPETLRVSAGDGYFESGDGGESWRTPRQGLDVGYLRSVAVDPGDPDVVVVSAASRARSAYTAGRSDGRLYRRVGSGPWQRIVDGWPDRPGTIAPLLAAGREDGELWAADERGVHHSFDGGAGWERVAAVPGTPDHLRGLAVVGGG